MFKRAVTDGYGRRRVIPSLMWALYVWLAIFLLGGCTQALPAGADAATATPGLQATPRWPEVERVLIVSVDGLRPDVITAERTPYMWALAQSGAYSWSAQTISPSLTLPAHLSMLAGIDYEKHGVWWNDNLPHRPPLRFTNIFSLAHTAGYETMMAIGKAKLVEIVRAGKLPDEQILLPTDREISAAAAQALRPDLRLIFVHFLQPDKVGHRFNWMSAEYLATVAEADQALGTLLEALEEQEMRAGTVIVLTSDHGGRLNHHVAPVPENRTIPWIINGPHVRRGHPLATEIRTMDTAATAAYILGLEIPETWDGRPVLEAFKEE